MDVETQKRAQEIFERVADLAGAARDQALEQACGDDAELRSLVEEWLSFDTAADSALAVLDESLEEALGPTPLEPGMLVDRYRVVRLLGTGGTARVWEVHHRTLNTRHALKVLTWADPRLQQRLLREARTQAALQHPNLVPVHDVIEVNGAPGLLMPMIDGPPLNELLRETRLSVDQALSLLRGVCEGVAYAHDQGFAHRDIKPGNVLIEIGPRHLVPRVADFGLVKGGGQRTMTRPGMVMGTLSYAAPEQLMDSSLAAEAADVWSLGIVAYELLAGQRPFQARGLTEVLEAHEAGPELDLLPADTPAQVRALLAEMLHLDPRGRPADAVEVLARLPELPPLRVDSPLGVRAQELRLPEATTHQAQTQGTSVRPSQESPPEPAPTRSRWPLAIFGGLAALGVGLAVGLTQKPGPDPVPVVETPVQPEVEPAVEPDRDVEVEPVLVDAQVEPEPEPGPVAPTQDTPAPQRPDPVPVVAEMEPVQEPVVEEPEVAEPLVEQAAQTVPPAVVRVVGDPMQTRLVQDGGRILPPGPVPPGNYKFEALMEKRGNWVPLDLGELQPGQVVVVECYSDFSYCKVQP